MSAEQQANVFARKDDFLVEPSWQATTGVWIGAATVARLPRTTTAAELGSAVRAALTASRQGVPHPTDWKTFVSPLLQVAGLASWAALQRTADMCQIQAGPSGFRVVPTRNGGTRGDDRGYHTLGELAVELPNTAADDDLGAAVISAVAACR